MEEKNRQERIRKLSDTIMINGQLYREYDNGQANVLMPVDDPLKRAQLADNRRAIQQAFAIAENPIGGVAYGVAALAGPSPQKRDQAFATGAIADAVMRGAAPLGVTPRRPVASPRPQVVTPFGFPAIRYRDANSNGQAMGANATVASHMIGTGTKADRKITPPGASGYWKRDKEDRSHLVADVLGGSGDSALNLVVLAQNANRGRMAAFERRVAQHARSGDVVEYSATPIYGGGGLAPWGVLQTEYRSPGEFSARLVENRQRRSK